MPVLAVHGNHGIDTGNPVSAVSAEDAIFIALFEHMFLIGFCRSAGDALLFRGFQSLQEREVRGLAHRNWGPGFHDLIVPEPEFSIDMIGAQG